MLLKDVVKQMVKDYFIVVTGVLFSHTIFCMLFSPLAQFGLRELWNILIGSVIFVLPHLVFVSGRELNKRQWRLRLILQFLLLEATVIGSGHLLFDWLSGQGVIPHVVMVIMILAVYLTVMAVGWKHDQFSANQINRKLQALEKEEDR